MHQLLKLVKAPAAEVADGVGCSSDGDAARKAGKTGRIDVVGQHQNWNR
jgi:hypothetical protein